MYIRADHRTRRERICGRKGGGREEEGAGLLNKQVERRHSDVTSNPAPHPTPHKTSHEAYLDR